MRASWGLLTWIALILGAITAAACATSPHRRSAPLTKIESRELAPAVLSARVFAQLSEVADITEISDMHGQMQQAGPISRRPRRPLSDLMFWTRSRATGAPGLCRTTLVWVDFEPVGRSALGPWTRVRASGFSASHYYQFLAPPSAPAPPTMNEAERRRTDAACLALDPESNGFFKASDETLAWEGAWLLRNVLAQLASGRRDFTISCEEPGGNLTCESMLAYMQHGRFSNPATCDREPTGCWELDLGAVKMTVYADDNDAGIGEIKEIVLNPGDIIIADFLGD